MIRKRKWIWVVLFIIVVLLVVALATGTNIAVVRDYYRILDLARANLAHNQTLERELHGGPWLSITLGTLGFLVTLAGIILFFVRLLQEMRLNQLQSEFLASVSHALKTPIATLELSASLIKGGDLSSEETQSLWNSHDAELKRLKEEVNSLLEAARIQSDKPDIHSRWIVLEDWFEAAISNWQRMLGPKANLTRVGEPLSCSVLVDPKLLNLITDNLLDNARKFSQGEPTVIARTRILGPTQAWKKGRWQIQIEDKGLGFDPADSEKVFKRFFRSKTETSYAIPGTGLGLHIATQACKAMGISLKAESAGSGHGATFTLEGPYGNEQESMRKTSSQTS